MWETTCKWLEHVVVAHFHNNTFLRRLPDLLASELDSSLQERDTNSKRLSQKCKFVVLMLVLTKFSNSINISHSTYSPFYNTSFLLKNFTFVSTHITLHNWLASPRSDSNFSATRISSQLLVLLMSVLQSQRFNAATKADSWTWEALHLGANHQDGTEGCPIPNRSFCANHL